MAQDIVVQRTILTVEDGLGDRLLNDVTRDTFGFFWIGTRDGVSRFDGNAFLNFSPSSSPGSIRENNVVRLRKTQGGYVTMHMRRTHATDIDVLDVVSGQIHHLKCDSTHGVPGTLYDRVFDSIGRSVALSHDGDSLVLSRLNYNTMRYGEIGRWATDLISNFHTTRKSLVQLYLAPDGFLLTIDPGDGQRLLYTLKPGPHPNVDVQRNNGTIVTNLRQIAQAMSSHSPRLQSDISQFPEHSYQILEDTIGNVLIYSNNSSGKETIDAWLLRSNGDLVDYVEVMDGIDRLFAVYSDNLNTALHLVTNRGYEIVELRGRHVLRFADVIDHAQYGISGRGMCRLDSLHILMTTDFQGFSVLNTGDWSLSSPDTHPWIESYLNDGWYGRSVIKDVNGVVWGRLNSLQMFAIDPTLGSMDTFHNKNYAGAPITGPSGDFYLIGPNQISSFDPRTKTEIPLLDHTGVNPLDTIMGVWGLSSDQVLWVTTTHGLLKYDLESHVTTLFSGPAEIDERIAMNVLTVVAPQSMWIGTIGHGLLKFDLQSEQFTDQLTEVDGLCNSNIAGMLIDSSGKFWISTYDGLSCFDTTTRAFRNFYVEDGFSHDEFNRWSQYHDPITGRLFFGGMNGFNAFFATELLQQFEGTSPLRFSEIAWHDASTDAHSKVQMTGSNTASITVPASDRRVVIKYSLIDNADANKDQYFYRVNGLGDQWTSLGSETTLRLDFLPVGDLVCEIKAMGKKGDWTPEPLTLHIKVLQYWYLSWWAILIYLGLIGAATLFASRFLIKRRLELENARKLKELNQFKDDFFTKVTHEFRTPLTIVLGSAEILQSKISKSKQVGNEALQKHVGRIQSSGQNLLRLINQILDLTRSKEARWDLEYVNGDIIHFHKEVVESFEGLAERKKIVLGFSSNTQELTMHFDPRQLQLILHNLLSNAIKFTPEGGEVAVEIQRNTADRLEISVEDTGIGIPFNEQPDIFKKYFQASNHDNPDGTGIGLALVRDLVQKMGGSLSLESTPGQGSAFTVSMPVVQSTLPSVPLDTDAVEVHVSPLTSDHEIELLVVEDNPDICAFLRECLEEEYNVTITHDGLSGLRLAQTTIPDIILTDIMMPGIDGLEVCNRLKSDPATNHIPIVILSAKSTMENRIEGIHTGADAYLAKPFNLRELKAVLNNLLLQRKRLRKHLMTLVASGHTANQSLDQPDDPNEALILRLRLHIMDNLTDQGLNGESLAKIENMSYSTYHRKIGAITGLTPTQFVTSVRLEHALTLLNDSSLNISEIAYQCGYQDPKYFSRVFTRHFGKSPRQARMTARN